MKYNFERKNIMKMRLEILDWEMILDWFFGNFG